MSGEQLVDASLSGLWTALLLVVPLLVAGALAGASVGALAGALGIQDTTLARVARVLAVIGALALSMRWIGAQSQGLASEVWASMGDVDGPISSAAQRDSSRASERPGDAQP